MNTLFILIAIVVVIVIIKAITKRDLSESKEVIRDVPEGYEVNFDMLHGERFVPKKEPKLTPEGTFDWYTLYD